MPHRYHYDPNQPRAPQGHADGGQWVSGSSSPFQPVRFRPGKDPRKPNREPPTDNILNAFWALFRSLSLRNSREQQAVLTFKAREYSRGESGEFSIEQVKMLNRKEVDEACPGLELVQKLTDKATRKAGPKGAYTPMLYGTKVHNNLKDAINHPTEEDIEAIKYFKLSAEVSIKKTMAEGNQTREQAEQSKAAAERGEKRSIRVDVLEPVNETTVCVYDIKPVSGGWTVHVSTKFSRRSGKNMTGSDGSSSPKCGPEQRSNRAAGSRTKSTGKTIR